MSLKRWIDIGDLQKVEVTPKSLEDLLKMVDRDIKDSLIEQLSVDRRFATAYGAALNLANYVIRIQGCRVSARRGHHKITFDVAGHILGKGGDKFLDFFDLCRRKRNKVDYDFADVVSQTELTELIEMVAEFRKLVLTKKL